jgi:PhnB protein
MAKYAPAGWPVVIPRIAVDDPKSLVEFIHDVFGAEGDYKSERPSQLRIDNSLIMVGSTIEREAMPAFLYIYVKDADATYRRAIEMGAQSLEEPQDTPYGDRRAMIRDSWGNRWQIATHGGRFAP